MHMPPEQVLEQHSWPIAQGVPLCRQAKQLPFVQRPEQQSPSSVHACPL
jgi:hypothetical protein